MVALLDTEEYYCEETTWKNRSQQCKNYCNVNG